MQGPHTPPSLSRRAAPRLASSKLSVPDSPDPIDALRSAGPATDAAREEHFAAPAFPHNARTRRWLSAFPRRGSGTSSSPSRAGAHHGSPPPHRDQRGRAIVRTADDPGNEGDYS